MPLMPKFEGLLVRGWPGAPGTAREGPRRVPGVMYQGVMTITLRPLKAADHDAIFLMMQDPESIRMAAFTADDPSDRAMFDEHMARISARKDVTNRLIEEDGRMAGTVAAFMADGMTEITYWIDRRYWGRGIASTALALLLEIVDSRPIRARAASDNAASLRVLEKAGFRVVGTDVGFAAGRGTEIEETILELT